MLTVSLIEVYVSIGTKCTVRSISCGSAIFGKFDECPNFLYELIEDSSVQFFLSNTYLKPYIQHVKKN